MDQELLALVKQRESAARRRMEGLRAELAALNERIAAAEEEPSDLVVTQATLTVVLRLRTVISNGDFEEYRQYHAQREHLRVHAIRYRDSLALAA